MKPDGALSLAVDCDLSQAGLEQALLTIGDTDPDFFVIRVHPYSVHLAQYIAWPNHHWKDKPYPFGNMYGWKFEVIPDLYQEYEWSVTVNKKTVWCRGS